VADLGGGTLSVSADKVRKGAKVLVPLNQAKGEVMAHSPDGTFTLDIQYKVDSGSVKASIDCSPIALLTAAGQTAPHLSDISLGKSPTRIDVKGGAAGDYSFVLAHQR
jgi:hypothetical protein